MGIMLILKGATYTPPTNNPGNGGGTFTDPDENNPGNPGGNGNQEQQPVTGPIAPHSVYVVGPPYMYRTDNVTAQGAITGKSVNRLFVLWSFGTPLPTTVAVHLSALKDKYKYYSFQVDEMPTEERLGYGTWEAEHSLDYDSNVPWYKASDEDLTITPDPRAAGIFILFCRDTSSNGPINDPTELMEIIQQLVNAN